MNSGGYLPSRDIGATTDSDGVLCVEPNLGVHHGKIVHCHN